MSRRWQVQNKQAIKCRGKLKLLPQDVGKNCALSPLLFRSQYYFHMLYVFSLDVFSTEEKIKRHSKETLCSGRSYAQSLKKNPLWVTYYLESTSGGCRAAGGGVGRGGLWLVLTVGDGTWGLALLLWPCGAAPVPAKKTTLAEKHDRCLLRRKVYRP